MAGDAPLHVASASLLVLDPSGALTIATEILGLFKKVLALVQNTKEPEVLRTVEHWMEKRGLEAFKKRIDKLMKEIGRAHV